MLPLVGGSSPVMHRNSVDLPGAVRTEQGDDLALVHRDVEPEQDLHRPVRRVDPLDLQQRARSSQRSGDDLGLVLGSVGVIDPFVGDEARDEHPASVGEAA